MKAKEDMINKIRTALSKEIEFIRINNEIDLDEKVEQIDVLFDTIKFLKNYDENIKILNRYRTDKEVEKGD